LIGGGFNRKKYIILVLILHRGVLKRRFSLYLDPEKVDKALRRLNISAKEGYSKAFEQMLTRLIEGNFFKTLKAELRCLLRVIIKDAYYCVKNPPKTIKIGDGSLESVKQICAICKEKDLMNRMEKLLNKPEIWIPYCKLGAFLKPEGKIICPLTYEAQDVDKCEGCKDLTRIKVKPQPLKTKKNRR